MSGTSFQSSPHLKRLGQRSPAQPDAVLPHNEDEGVVDKVEHRNRILQSLENFYAALDSYEQTSRPLNTDLVRWMVYGCKLELEHGDTKVIWKRGESLDVKVDKALAHAADGIDELYNKVCDESRRDATGSDWRATSKSHQSWAAASMLKEKFVVFRARVEHWLKETELFDIDQAVKYEDDAEV